MRGLLVPLALALSACAPAPVPAPVAPAPAPVPAAPPPAPVPVPAAPDATLRAVFHLSDPNRAANLRGLENVRRALDALGAAPARIVLVVHGQAVGWLRRGEPDNLAAPVAALLATGKVELRVCARTLEEFHWQAAELVAGAAVVPSGTLEVLRLEREGFVYFKP
jgi:intracellular sulfur oxidation DsrE/DsrF family protein